MFRLAALSFSHSAKWTQVLPFRHRAHRHVPVSSRCRHPVPRSLLDSAPRASCIAVAASGMLISSWYRSAEARSSRCQPNSVSRLRATGNSSEAINGKVMNLGSAATRHGHRPSRRCPTERNKASPIAGWHQQTARHETVSEQAPRDSPVTAMNNFIEWPAIRLADRREGAIGGIPKSEKVSHDVVVGDTQDRAGLVLFADCRMTGADAEVGGLDHHGHCRLAQVVLIEELPPLIGRHRGNQCNSRRSRRDMARALPHSGQLLQPIRIGDKHEIPGLAV